MCSALVRTELLNPTQPSKMPQAYITIRFSSAHARSSIRVGIGPLKGAWQELMHLSSQPHLEKMGERGEERRERERKTRARRKGGGCLSLTRSALSDRSSSIELAWLELS